MLFFLTLGVTLDSDRVGHWWGHALLLGGLPWRPVSYAHHTLRETEAVRAHSPGPASIPASPPSAARGGLSYQQPLRILTETLVLTLLRVPFCGQMCPRETLGAVKIKLITRRTKRKHPPAPQVPFPFENKVSHGEIMAGKTHLLGLEENGRIDFLRSQPGR